MNDFLIPLLKKTLLAKAVLAKAGLSRISSYRESPAFANPVILKTTNFSSWF